MVVMMMSHPMTGLVILAEVMVMMEMMEVMRMETIELMEMMSFHSKMAEIGSHLNVVA